MKRIRNLAILLAAVIVVVVIAVFASRGKHSDALGVRTIRVTPTTFQVKLPESGVIMRPLVATVPTLIAGNVEQIFVKAGDQVSAGQTLATIENPTLAYQAAGSQADYTSAAANVTAAQVQERNAGVGYRATVQTTLSQLNDARRIYLADRSLYDNKAIPRNQLDELTRRHLAITGEIPHRRPAQRARQGVGKFGEVGLERRERAIVKA